MQPVRITIDDRLLRRQLTNLERVQLPYAGAMALNDTAKDALKHIQDRMKVEFDRPTRWTLNAFMVWRATKSLLEAQVKERPDVGPRHYLKIQERGGARPQTGVEKLLSANAAYDGILSAIVPAAGARLDSYGNWSSGERNQVLSALGAQRDKAANQTDASRKRNRKRATYFVPKRGLGAGVWRRTVDGELDKVISFTHAMPTYAPRLGFYEGVDEVWRKRLPEHLENRLARAVAKAR